VPRVLLTRVGWGRQAKIHAFLYVFPFLRFVMVKWRVRDTESYYEKKPRR